MNAPARFPVIDPRDRAFIPHVEDCGARAGALYAEIHAGDVERGAREMINRPSLVGNIFRRRSTEQLARTTLADLAAYLARKPTRTLGDRQLEAALRDPRFCAAWQAWREREIQNA